LELAVDARMSPWLNVLIDKETRQFRGLWKRHYGICSVYNLKTAEWEAWSEDDRVWQEVLDDEVHENANAAGSAGDDSDATLGLPGSGGDDSDDFVYLNQPLLVVSSDGRVAGDNDDTQAREVALA
jgi:hypothetical protein